VTGMSFQCVSSVLLFFLWRNTIQRNDCFGNTGARQNINSCLLVAFSQTIVKTIETGNANITVFWVRFLKVELPRHGSRECRFEGGSSSTLMWAPSAFLIGARGRVFLAVATAPLRACSLHFEVWLLWGWGSRRPTAPPRRRPRRPRAPTGVLGGLRHHLALAAGLAVAARHPAKRERYCAQNAPSRKRRKIA